MYVNWGGADLGDRSTNCFIKTSNGEQVVLAGDWKHNNKIEPAVAGWQDYYNKSTVNFNGMINTVIPLWLVSLILAMNIIFIQLTNKMW